MCYPATLFFFPLKDQYSVKKKKILQRKQSRNVRPMKVQFIGWCQSVDWVLKCFAMHEENKEKYASGSTLH